MRGDFSSMTKFPVHFLLPDQVILYRLMILDEEVCCT